MTRPRPLLPREDPADSVRVVGEFGVIARVVARSGAARVADVGPGDDAAVLRVPDGRVVATTDVLVAGLEPTADEAMLISLLNANDLVKRIVPKDDRRAARR